MGLGPVVVVVVGVVLEDEAGRVSAAVVVSLGPISAMVVTAKGEEEEDVGLTVSIMLDEVSEEEEQAVVVVVVVISATVVTAMVEASEDMMTETTFLLFSPFPSLFPISLLLNSSPRRELGSENASQLSQVHRSVQFSSSVRPSVRPSVKFAK